MRLKMRVVAGMIVVTGLALSLPAKTKDDSDDAATGVQKPGKLSHLMFHKSAKKDPTAEPKTVAQHQAPKHTNGFPEADKKSAAYQPQAANQAWADDNWKTSRNKDTFKQTDAK